MQESIEKYSISKSFYKRYFLQNALNRMSMELLKFMWFKEGKFLNPMKKNQIIDEYIKEEIDDFFCKNILNIPQVELCITTKCTLTCRDCCALIPKFDSNCHIDMSYEEFKLYTDKVLNSVNSIRHFVILGGEPLINPDLPQMIDYVCQQDKISFVQLITNGTMHFSEKLLDVLILNKKKLYIYISNYSLNEHLKPLLKHEKIREVLKENDIKLQMAENKDWVTEKEFANDPSDEYTTINKIQKCFRTHCNQILGGKLDICSKAATARELGLLKLSDYVDIEKSINLKQDLISFYKRDFAEACRYCILSDEIVKPAIQKS